MTQSTFIAGVDEAGRGPLAGPVVAAAVILPSQYDLPGLDDSKKLSEKKRRQLATNIQRQALASAVAWAEAIEIDSVNILQATFLAMRRAVARLSISPQLLLIDGNRVPEFAAAGLACDVKSVVGGDATVATISAASILAKVHRDHLMCALDQQFPQYGFAAHKGYPTKKHLLQLNEYGPSPLHRYTFRPVASLPALASGRKQAG